MSYILLAFVPNSKCFFLCNGIHVQSAKYLRMSIETWQFPVIGTLANSDTGRPVYFLPFIFTPFRQPWARSA